MKLLSNRWGNVLETKTGESHLFAAYLLIIDMIIFRPHGDISVQIGVDFSKKKVIY